MLPGTPENFTRYILWIPQKYLCFNCMSFTVPVPWEITDQAFPPYYWCHLSEIWRSRPLAPTWCSCLGDPRHGDRQHPALYSTHTGHDRTPGEELCKKKIKKWQTFIFSPDFCILAKLVMSKSYTKICHQKTRSFQKLASPKYM